MARPMSHPPPSLPLSAVVSCRPAGPLGPARPAMPVSTIAHGMLGGPDPAHAPAAVLRAGRRRQGNLAAGEEAQQQIIGLVRALHLRNVSAGLDRDLLGAGQPLGDMPAEGGWDQVIVCAPDEQ